MRARTHRVQSHRSGVPGIAAMTLLSDHRFPRHSHDELGIGIDQSHMTRAFVRHFGITPGSFRRSRAA